MGVDLTQPNLGPIKVKEWLKEGHFPENPGEVVLEKHYAKFRQAGLGGAFPIGNRSSR
jgi:putative ABC transport system permease protein